MSNSRSPLAVRSMTIGISGIAPPYRALPAKPRPRAPQLAVDRRHAFGVVAVAGGRRHGRRDLLGLVRRQTDLGRPEVLLQIGGALRARDRHDVLAAAEHPGDRELAG